MPRVHPDEAHPYNQKVNRIAPIQEHLMMEALRDGASEERIAQALAPQSAASDLVVGICPDASIC
jgi:hypothetical protein